MLLAGIGCSSRTSTGEAASSPVAREPNRHEFSRLLMGVQARILLFHEDVRVAEEAANAAFDRIAGLDAILSDHRVDSEVNRLCSFAGTGEAVPVSDDLFEVLRQSIEFSRASGGAFDVTVGPVVSLWREARRSGVIPSREEISRAMQSVGWEKIELDEMNQTARLLAPGMGLDFGGIGKGYACDEALKVLRAFGCPRAMIEMGGDIALGDPPVDAPGWFIFPPDDDPEDGWHPIQDPEVWEKLLVRVNCGVGTSGDRYQFVEFEGVRYSHVIDPRGGWAVRDSIEVTVIASDATTSDALATVVGVLGIEAGAAIVEQFSGAQVVEN